MVSKTVLIIVGVILLVIIGVVAVLYFSTRPPGLPAGAKDCRSDPLCFKQSLSGGCAPARLTVSQKGVSLIADVRGVAQGATPQSCLIYIKPTEFNPQGLSQEQASQLAQVKGLLLASDMTCKVPVAEVGLIDSPDYLMKPERLQQCEGSLKSFIELAIKQSGPSPAS